MSKSTLILTLLFSFTLIGCETIGGAGRDISKAGDVIQDVVN